jgi:hypothetical protein
LPDEALDAPDIGFVINADVSELAVRLQILDFIILLLMSLENTPQNYSTTTSTKKLNK